MLVYLIITHFKKTPFQKCQYMEFQWSAFSRCILKNCRFFLNTGKYGSEKTSILTNFIRWGNFDNNSVFDFQTLSTNTLMHSNFQNIKLSICQMWNGTIRMENTAWKVSVIGIILVRISPHSDHGETRTSPYSVRMRGNTDQNNSEWEGTPIFIFYKLSLEESG